MNVRDTLSRTTLEQTDFRENPIRIGQLKDKHSFINNFKEGLSQQNVINLIKKNPLIKFMDAIFSKMANRDFALKQQLTLELAYEDKEEWGVDRDNLNISIQLEIIGEE